MPILSCIPRKRREIKQKKVIPIENLLLHICETMKPMVNAGVTCFGSTIRIYGGHEYQYTTTYEGGNYKLNIEVINKLESLIYEVDEKNECVVCTEDTHEKITCCKQDICLKCLKEIKKTCEQENMDFCCPVCRKNLNNSRTNYEFDKYFLDKINEVDGNEKESLHFIKNTLK
tara:strand:+ start:180 stop:698 length:519 start_codon:yes stop_codon:yes gene_type:complete